MAISKVILNGDTLMDVTSDTVEAGKLLSNETATKNDGTKVTGNIANRSSTDIIVDGPIVTTVAGYYPLAVSTSIEEGSAFTPAVTITDTPWIGFEPATGVISASFTAWSSVAPTINPGYVSTGTAGRISASGRASLSLPILSAQTFYPSTARQTIASSVWLTGEQTIASVSINHLESDYIKSGVTVTVGDTANPSRIKQVTGIYSGGEYGRYRAFITSDINDGRLSYNGSYYRDANTGFNFNAGDTITLRAVTSGGYGVNINIDGVTVSNGGLNPTIYSYTPNTYFEAYDDSNGLNIHTYVIPSGTYSITSNGTYDVGSYKSVSVNATGEYYGIYKALAQRHRVTTNGTSAYTAQEVSNYCDSLSYIDNYQFVGRDFTPSGVTFNNVSRVGDGAFGSIAVGAEVAGGYYGSITYSFPNCTLISSAAFRGNTLIKEINAPECSIIGAYAFYGCTSLTTINFSKCTSISIYGFYSCYRLTVANFPKCTSIGLYGFQYCSKLLEANFPLLSEIKTNVFSSCQQLSITSFPMVTTIGSGAFAYCRSLVTISFPLATIIQDSAFTYCINLSTIDCPNCSRIGTSAFTGCYNLSIVSFPLVEAISNYAFSACYNLLSLYLLGSSVPTLTSYAAFRSTPIYGYTTSTDGVYGSIYVPASLYDSYITATNWSLFSSRIVSVQGGNS